MTFKVILSLLLLLITTILFGQTRTVTVTGKIIDENFQPVYQAKIDNLDSSLWVITDSSGNFKLEIPRDTKSIVISSIGMERKNIYLTGDCNNLDIIFLNRAIYDFISAAKVDRLRKKDFDKLPRLHQAAFKKGIFKMDRPCYVDKFIPIEKRLKEIHKNRTQMPST